MVDNLFRTRFIELYGQNVYDFMCEKFQKNLQGQIFANIDTGCHGVTSNKFNRALRCWLNQHGLDYIEAMATTKRFGYTRVKRIIDGYCMQRRGTFTQTVDYYLNDFLANIDVRLKRSYGDLQISLLRIYYKQWQQFNDIHEIYTVNESQLIAAVVKKIEHAGAFVVKHARFIQWKY